MYFKQFLHDETGIIHRVAGFARGGGSRPSVRHPAPPGRGRAVWLHQLAEVQFPFRPVHDGAEIHVGRVER